MLEMMENGIFQIVSVFRNQNKFIVLVWSLFQLQSVHTKTVTLRLATREKKHTQLVSNPLTLT